MFYTDSYLAIEDVNFRKLPRDGHGDEEGRFKMSVQIPPVDPDRTFTAEQRREIVLAHAETKHGLKGEFLRAAGVTPRQLYLWRRQLAAGTLDIGLTPRENIPMSDKNIVEFSRLTQRNQELEALNAELGAERAKFETERAKFETERAKLETRHAKLEARIAELEKAVADKDAATTAHAKAVEAMGKAIAAMQKYTDR